MLRRRRGSVSTPRSGPSLIGPLVLGSPGGQPKSQKAFWAACLSWCCFRRAAPRAVGSRSRVGLLARKSAAVGGGGRLRGSFVAACLPLCFWVPHPPAARGPEKRLGGGDGSRYVWFVVDGVFRFEASESLPKIICSEQCPRRLLPLFEHFWVALNRKKHIASKLIPRATTSQPRCNKDQLQPCSPAPREP